MNATDIVNLRLRAQQLTAHRFKSPEQVVGWMGAMQSQHFPMSKWAVGLRLSRSTVAAIDQALDEGKIIRTHVMRPTWHLVAAEDIYWMLRLTAPAIRVLMRSVHKQLELTDKLFLKTQKLIAKALQHKDLTRDELVLVFKKAKIGLSENRTAHMLIDAELNGLICSGRAIGDKQTYTLLEKRITIKQQIGKEEALIKLAKRYFLSHGPASLNDFSWWSGLTLTDAKKAVAALKGTLAFGKYRSETYYFDPALNPAEKMKSSVLLLPAYDEFIIAYKDRTATVAADHHNRLISSNGIFWPSIVVNGKVTGMWKLLAGKEKLILEADHYKAPSPMVKRRIGERTNAFGKFLGMPAELK